MAEVIVEPKERVGGVPSPTAEGGRAAIPIAPLYALLDEAVAAFGDRPCIDFLDKRYSYREVAALVDRAAKGFQALGVGPGLRVGLFLPNCPYYVVCYYAVLKAGGIVVNFNPLLAERQIEQQIEDSGVELMVTLDLAVLYGKLAPMLGRTCLKRLVIGRLADVLPFPKNRLFPIVHRADLARIPSDERHVPFARLLDNDGRFRPVEPDPAADVAVLQYTGGTTGVPKAAMLTHGNLYANAEQVGRWFSSCQAGRERMLGVLPLFHVFAMTVVMNVSVRIGAEMVLLPRFEIDQLMRTIHRKRPTLFPAVPTIYTAINTYKDRGKYDLSSIQMCISGGAPLPLEVKETFERLTGCTLVEGYGLSEASPVVTCNPMDGLNKAGSIGLPLPGTTVEIVSIEDRKTVLPPGEKGELCVRGPQVMTGYWRREEETAEVLVDGLLHTGDVAYRDSDGYVFLVDRLKDMILVGGCNVYPRMVEEAIYLHPAVEECVVAGVPDSYRGQTVKAWIKVADGKTLTAEELKSFLKDKLSPVETPKLVELRDQPLPKTLVGKLSRKALLEEEASRAGSP